MGQVEDGWGLEGAGAEVSFKVLTEEVTPTLE